MTTEDLASFAVRLYSRDGMAERLLALQDRHGLDVLLLLTAIWTNERQMVLSDESWAALVASHRPLAEGVILPLRQARRTARDLPQLGRHYQDLKRLEVAIELKQLELLEGECRKLGRDGNASPEVALRQCCDAQGVAIGAELGAALRTLVTA